MKQQQTVTQKLPFCVDSAQKLFTFTWRKTEIMSAMKARRALKSVCAKQTTYWRVAEVTGGGKKVSF